MDKGEQGYSEKKEILWVPISNDQLEVPFIKALSKESVEGYDQAVHFDITVGNDPFIDGVIFIRGERDPNEEVYLKTVKREGSLTRQFYMTSEGAAHVIMHDPIAITDISSSNIVGHCYYSTRLTTIVKRRRGPNHIFYQR